MQRLIYSAFTVTAVFLVTLFIESCASNDLDEYTPIEPEECATTVSYSNDITEIVNTKCAISGCHNGDLGQERNWTNYETFAAHAEDVKFKVINRIMPLESSPAGPLSDEQIQTISCWVDQGAQNN